MEDLGSKIEDRRIETPAPGLRKGWAFAFCCVPERTLTLEIEHEVQSGQTLLALTRTDNCSS